MKHTLLFTAICSFIITAFLVGCSPSKTLTGADKDAVLAYAEPETDNLLLSYNQKDYASFSKNFDATMLKGITETSFNQTEGSLKARIGKYVSRSVDSVVFDGKFTQVIYRAKFELDDPVTVRLVFNQDEGHTISGLWFDSARLRQK